MRVIRSVYALVDMPYAYTARAASLARKVNFKAFLKTKLYKVIFVGVGSIYSEHLIFSRESGIQSIFTLAYNDLLCPAELNSLIRIEIRRCLTAAAVVAAALKREPVCKGPRQFRRAARANLSVIDILRAEVMSDLVARSTDRLKNARCQIFSDI